MIRFALLTIVLTNPVAAQDFQVDRDAVTLCYEGATTGESVLPCVGDAAERCMESSEDGFSTANMLSCVAAETAIWDEFLNVAYRDLRANMRELDADSPSGEILRADALRDAQRAWIAFRDAECLFNWAIFQEGTMSSLVSSSCFLDMTAQRTFELRNQAEMPG